MSLFDPQRWGLRHSAIYNLAIICMVFGPDLKPVLRPRLTIQVNMDGYICVVS